MSKAGQNLDAWQHDAIGAGYENWAQLSDAALEYGKEFERERILDAILNLPKPEHPTNDTVTFRAGYRKAMIQALTIVNTRKGEGEG